MKFHPVIGQFVLVEGAEAAVLTLLRPGLSFEAMRVRPVLLHRRVVGGEVAIGALSLAL